MNLEFRRFSVDDVNMAERKIIGHAAVFGNEDAYGDVIERGSFAKTVDENRSRIKVFYNHTYPIGLPEVLREDEKGLYTESKISKTPRADEVLELVRDGVINEMSIGYEALKYEPKGRGRSLREIRLYEYGPVDLAANDQALITGVKSLAERLEMGQVGRASIDEIKSAISALEIAVKRANGEPVSTTPIEPSIDTLAAELTHDFATWLADASRTISRRYTHE